MALPAGTVVAVALEVPRYPPGDVGARRFEAQGLVDGAGQQAAVFGDLPSLVGMFGEDLGQPSDQPAGCLVAGAATTWV
jgi:hypothetical protein